MPSRIAINPLPWILDATTGFHLDRPSLTAAFSTVGRIGFTSVQADIPADLSPAEYLDLLAEFELDPAPSYFGADFEDEANLATVLDLARDHARAQLAIGNRMTFLAGNLCPERREHPAIGAQFDAQRLRLVVAGVEAVSRAFADEGLITGLHPHVGSWIETEREIRSVLDSVGPEILGFGPDTGHLAWAGMKPESIIHDYADRVVGVHIKDVDPAAAAIARSDRADYATATESIHVWTEPGRGSVDFDRVFESLPAGFDGWFMLEVDVPNRGDAEVSTQTSAEWIAKQRRFDGSLR